MKVRILSIGADKSGLFEPAIAEYLKRIRRYVPVELVELPPSKKGGIDPQRAREEEGQSLLSRLKDSERVVVLDERGDLMGSEAFSREIVQDAMNRGRDLAFLIGGAEGHSAAVRSRADRILALSPLTLAHRLARLVLVEQLYRGFAIARGEPYHK
ncbi:23S rRNA (pseudouridine(1915)-N(3))-methyltransferase RlmH [Vulgatibacter incomptus]|uniref:Ribosomal RNA large subunit methyltransferase H n=1 Tax=Vulgatibacter incomptus TaxID=1391653 RepID=A0A0K1PFT8_9BACT|nr:23S rRNA (pseudouridine(1915)-N(3))-methyltransferase RlmH [Vulgatibacter incomptus]AKU92276.1 LSU m3Psi1915 methyltransferase RlmH [Vulgatibacter incomptus]